MKRIIFLSLIIYAQLGFSSDPRELYFDYFQAKKYYSLDQLDSALSCLNRFQNTDKFDSYAAKLKLKVMYKLKKSNLVDHFFELVKKTGITDEDLVYNALKTKEDSIYFLSRYPKESFSQQYKVSQKVYLNGLSTPFYAISIDGIMRQDKIVRLIGWGINRADSSSYKLWQNQLHKADSLNFEEIKELISQYGLPTHNKLGVSQYDLVLMAGMHLSVNPILKEEAYNYFDSILKKTVLLGQMNPEYYMYFKDAVSRKLNGCQIYGYLIFTHPKIKTKSLFTFCDDRRSVIDKLRKEIGAGKIEDECRYVSAYCNFIND